MLPLYCFPQILVTQKEAVTGFWVVKDIYDFENVALTKSNEGVKYLECADCESGGIIGFLDAESKLHYVSNARVSSKCIPHDVE
ncbi:hypothetical protein KIN20_030404 [Parelaphostrongylus tenuis]|uniref:Uncharacterized protein n=1 Tax=Parelaphostrongylus tenuis TaxID=148309 RepID=A0AAD5R459_PARTN|nr:hypothetical protein KIN20_015032 [Parelaphostrongylus tenuis]KAJ1369026.1 hypothetical protein KIN20_030404 [Parelaphostrongylus tenuis]